MTAEPTFTITRDFDAPRARVWNAWTDSKSMTQWFGPKGFTCRIAKLELRPGGVTHSYLKSPDGIEMWGKFVYREIDAPSRLVWVHSFADEHGNVVRHPFSVTWPLTMLTTVIFVEKPGKTTITLTWIPLDATDDECKTFAEGMDSMQQGWGGTFDQLEEFLKKN
jgi:uncharacterized protein YndB with AHSA1/START domain